MSNKRESLWDPDARELLRAVTRLDSIPRARRFIRDLMTEEEIRMIVDRWRVARMLHDGSSYREIGEATGLSSRTIARISRWLQEGEGGYRSMLALAKEPVKGSKTTGGSDGGLSGHRRPNRPA